MAKVQQEFTNIKLTVPWGHISARTYGSSTGKPVLLLHGRQDNAGSFTRLMKYLPKESFYYVCIDLPGHGWSSPFPSWMMIHFMVYVHSLHFILEALQWKTCTVIGHSMGAQITLMFSVFHPNRIEKLISFDGVLMISREKFFFALKDFVTYFETASIYSVQHSHEKKHDKKLVSLTKEEIMHSLMTKRFYPMIYEAADALFERAVTEVNGKYRYNSDTRLRNHLPPFSFMLIDEFQGYNDKLPMMPIYLFVASNGIIFPFLKEHKSALETMKAKTMLQIIYIDGNHDVHTNEPEKVAPFVCDILNSNNSNKL